jgi:plastocyanin
VEDSQYDPTSVTIARGSTVTWTWQGALQHSVTFEDGVGSANLRTSGTLDRTFNTAGTFRFRCTAHSSTFSGGMVGSVVVQ